MVDISTTNFLVGSDLDKCVFSFPFRCSSILNALTCKRPDVNIIYTGKIPSNAFPKKKGWLRYDKIFFFFSTRNYLYPLFISFILCFLISILVELKIVVNSFLGFLDPLSTLLLLGVLLLYQTLSLM